MKMEGLEMQGEQMRLEFESRSENEKFARMVVAAFMLKCNPTVEELEAKPTPYLSRLAPRDIVVGLLTAVACIAVMLLLNLHDFQPPVRLVASPHA